MINVRILKNKLKKFDIHDFLNYFIFKAQNQLNVKNSKFKVNEF